MKPKWKKLDELRDDMRGCINRLNANRESERSLSVLEGLVQEYKEILQKEDDPS